MNWQQIVSLLIVAVVAALFLRARLQRRRFSFARPTHCGCGGAPDRPNQSVIYHARKGERPEIIVKMK